MIDDMDYSADERRSLRVICRTSLRHGASGIPFLALVKSSPSCYSPVRVQSGRGIDLTWLIFPAHGDNFRARFLIDGKLTYWLRMETGKPLTSMTRFASLLIDRRKKANKSGRGHTAFDLRTLTSFLAFMVIPPGEMR
jgi:hypothetical protein